MCQKVVQPLDETALECQLAALATMIFFQSCRKIEAFDADLNS